MVLRNVGLAADCSSPESARMIGTPDLSRVCICRDRSIRSASSTLGSPKLSCSLLAATATAAFASSICTGVTPVLNSWSATALLVGPSRVPFTSSPRALRPWYANCGMVLFLGVADAHDLVQRSAPVRRQLRGMVHERVPRHLFFRDAHEGADVFLGGGLDQPRRHFEHLVHAAAPAVAAAVAMGAALALPVAAFSRAAPPGLDETPLLRRGRIVLAAALADQ